MTESNEVLETHTENHMLKSSEATKYISSNENSALIEVSPHNNNSAPDNVHVFVIDSKISDEDDSTDNEARNDAKTYCHGNETEQSDTTDTENEKSSDNETKSDSETTDNKDQSDLTDTENEKSSNEYKKHLEECIRNVSRLEGHCCQLNEKCKELESRLEMTTKHHDMAIKEKEMIVMRYAVSEKAVLDLKAGKEIAEKKHKEAVRENEILQHKVTSMGVEKSRICQMLDNKCYEYKSSQQELERVKADLNALETKLKWSQNNLRTEMELRKESEAKVEALSSKLQESAEQVEQAKREAQESIRVFHHSQDNRANVLDQQLKEQQANLILLRHERDDRENQVKTLQTELERLQSKQKETLQENNTLSLKIQQLERERLETGQRLSELRGCADQQRQDAADLIAKTAQLEQLKLQIQNEQEQLSACNEQMTLLKQRNAELESDMELCREREAELLLFTQQLTDKNVRLQSEFTAMETKVQQLTCEQTLLKRATKEQETKAEILAAQLTEARTKRIEEVNELSKNLAEKCKLCELLTQEVADQKGENSVIKRKLEFSLKEVNKELQQCRKKLEQYETASTSSNSSSTSLNAIDQSSGSPTPPVPADQVKVIQPETTVDKQTLIEHIVKLQRISARKSEKIDFLEEHINTLVSELQRKTRLLQGYIMREQAGTLTSNKMDNNKAHIAKLHGVMASVYGSRVADSNLTLELSLDINNKLQAVLEDALLKNITLKENVDTLGAEIERLNKLLKASCSS
ncbi:hypothetical protein ILUMI_09833 [Ignelater luminosus]|uniref:Coiled-coil domain-containing protein 186 n=1 Tax=Ignelater luminosus TaxID=2038154 RepID=A0A8K0GEP0_IGNLU|nr:hypothetical protein ILUMI_09833 [Ignelater luminosus]